MGLEFTESVIAENMPEYAVAIPQSVILLFETPVTYTPTLLSVQLK